MVSQTTENSFWAVWSQFESNHGNEDTLRDMLRIKRSVQAKFNVQVGVKFLCNQCFYFEIYKVVKCFLSHSVFS